MVQYENECVGCHTEMGCMGEICPNRNVPRRYCDTCGDPACCTIDDSDYCEFHASEIMGDLFNGLSLEEKAELFDIDFTKIK